MQIGYSIPHGTFGRDFRGSITPSARRTLPRFNMLRSNSGAGIEHLWFDMVVTSVGGELDIREYAHCKGDSTKMYKVLDQLSPDHTKLVPFTNISSSLDRNLPPVTEWDMPKLKRLHGEISKYLHFFGIPNETTDSPEWFLEALTTIETGADYIWHNLTTTHTGQMKISSMPPAVRDTWEGFRTGRLDEESVRTRLHLAQPVLQKRASGK